MLTFFCRFLLEKYFNLVLFIPLYSKCIILPTVGDQKCHSTVRHGRWAFQGCVIFKIWNVNVSKNNVGVSNWPSVLSVLHLEKNVFLLHGIPLLKSHAKNLQNEMLIFYSVKWASLPLQHLPAYISHSGEEHACWKFISLVRPKSCISVRCVYLAYSMYFYLFIINSGYNLFNQMIQSILP